MKRLALVVVTIVAAFAAMAPAADGAEDQHVSAQRWAQRVCTATLPGAERLARELNLATEHEATTNRQRVEEIRTLVVGLEAALRGMRNAIVEAGVPRIADGRQVVRRIVADFDAILYRIRAVRRDVDGLLGGSDRALVEEAREVALRLRQALSRDAFAPLARHWPPALRRAVDLAPACESLAEAFPRGGTSVF